ncbi:DUF2017 domain-containing protein [Microbacterium sp. zg-YB36]|uniref:DUF2017 domain-containing protein n=1 Tax=Microbacterium sp. zg-YB36 TaxID=2969407 RepID=UPI00214ADB0B|nr:DUF2017 domain-containing protein [Microbacterium sp. zg-YB36]MDL5350404.1 DUF2017 domain-containing protein [Microbacterium sp. zg-YB36]
MTGEHVVVLELTLIEGAHLADLVTQFADLLADRPADGTTVPDDPAIARLVPDAYREDAEAAREFRALTSADLLDRRLDDAGAVLQDLSPDGVPLDASNLDDDTLMHTFVVRLPPERSRAWLRTLNALRLVLATRLGIDTEDDHAAGDPRFAIFDWLGYRLDGLVAALDD